jgi:hypothetical protein
MLADVLQADRQAGRCYATQRRRAETAALEYFYA